jgi:division protein CdvB (Snf7/Vps24/ESCRT-III family)
MDENQLRTIIDQVNQMGGDDKEMPQKIEYMMDFGSVAVMVNMSLN